MGIIVFFEEEDGDYSGYIDTRITPNKDLVIGIGDNKEEFISSIKEGIKDMVEHEWSNTEWAKIPLSEIVLTLVPLPKE